MTKSGARWHLTEQTVNYKTYNYKILSDEYLRIKTISGYHSIWVREAQLKRYQLLQFGGSWTTEEVPLEKMV